MSTYGTILLVIIKNFKEVACSFEQILTSACQLTVAMKASVTI